MADEEFDKQENEKQDHVDEKYGKLEEEEEKEKVSTVEIEIEPMEEKVEKVKIPKKVRIKEEEEEIDEKLHRDIEEGREIEKLKIRDAEEQEEQWEPRDPKDQKFKCRFCGLAYNYLTTLKAHERVHDVDEPYVCQSCGCSFRYHSELQGHNLQHRAVPGEKLYKCMCGRAFNKYTDLLYHKHADEEVQDPEPKESSSASASKDSSYLWKYPDSRKTYYCEYCLKAYANAHDLKYHMYSHRGERQFMVGASRYLMNRVT